MKQCKKCRLKLPLSKFFNSKRAKSGKQTYCKDCQNAMMNGRPIERRREIGRNSHAKHPYSAVWRQMNRRGGVLMMKETFVDWYKNQEKKCHYCDVTESIAIYQFKRRLHIDRKSSATGYVIENICLACTRCNLVKNKYLTEQQMKWVADNLFKGKDLSNSHYELLDAAKLLRAELQARLIDGGEESYQHDLDIVNQAIVKAEGK